MAAAGGALGNLSCGGDNSQGSGVTYQTSGRPNVIMIVVDTLRADHASVAGYLRDVLFGKLNLQSPVAGTYNIIQFIS